MKRNANPRRKAGPKHSRRFRNRENQSPSTLMENPTQPVKIFDRSQVSGMGISKYGNNDLESMQTSAWKRPLPPSYFFSIFYFCLCVKLREEY